MPSQRSEVTVLKIGLVRRICGSLIRPMADGISPLQARSHNLALAKRATRLATGHIASPCVEAVSDSRSYVGTSDGCTTGRRQGNAGP